MNHSVLSAGWVVPQLRGLVLSVCEVLNWHTHSVWPQTSSLNVGQPLCWSECGWNGTWTKLKMYCADLISKLPNDVKLSLQPQAVIYALLFQFQAFGWDWVLIVNNTLMKLCKAVQKILILSGIGNVLCSISLKLWFNSTVYTWVRSDKMRNISHYQVYISLCLSVSRAM